ncbi:hypothetical protein DN069_08025 [Streptacidiphilus pinicola]|uniref:Uncharacterized protein n=1 Tax=Streptacidiphilus pinicola TaxID=2219663 RepID=A0A2X0KH72_9ACTN|nr:hypothetical protein [Streptacidiphilus pinicola]RAG86120.1 hypothetical protein DN069_08025 [Streptacidiphilus pinicola]
MENTVPTLATSPAPAGWSHRRALFAATVCLIAAAVIVAYWAVWFTDRPLLASSSAPAYTEFENAFPLADAWLTVALLMAAAACLRARTAAARLWLGIAVGSGVYLFSVTPPPAGAGGFSLTLAGVATDQPGP